MRLTVLGGSAAGPNVGVGCSGYLVSEQGTNLVLDLGPGTLPELRRHANFRELDAVVISHLHLDHLLDVLALRFSLAYNPVRPERRTPLWLPPGGDQLFRQLAQSFGPDEPDEYFRSVFDLAEYDPTAPLAVGTMTLSFTPTVHYVPCWAIRVRGSRRGDLFYTADTGPTAALQVPAAGAATIVSEATLRRVDPDHDDAMRGHLTAAEAGALAADAGAERLVLSHLWQENGPRSAVRDAGSRFAGDVLLSHPGLVVEW